jgi:hypothetical protein
VFWLAPPDPKSKSVEVAYVDFARPACEAFKTRAVKRVVGITALGRGDSASEEGRVCLRFARYGRSNR